MYNVHLFLLELAANCEELAFPGTPSGEAVILRAGPNHTKLSGFKIIF